MAQDVALTAMSRETAASCLTSLLEVQGVTRDAFRPWDWLPGEQIFSLDTLTRSVADCGFEVTTLRLNWHLLLTEISRQPVLLLLDNGNFILALERNERAIEEIIISDPLHQNGEKCFLPRSKLESAWTGNSMVIAPRPSILERTLNLVILGFSVCFIIAAILLFTREATTLMGSTDRSLGRNSPERSDGSPIAQIQEPQLSAPNEDPESGDSNAERSAQEHTQEAQKSPSDRPRNERAREPRQVLRAHEIEPHETNTVVASSNGSDAGLNVLSAGIAITAVHPSASVEELAMATAMTGVEAVAPGSQSIPGKGVSLPWQENATMSGAESSGTELDISVKLKAEDVVALISRGDSLLAIGDLTAARLFYERAADAQNGQAALRLGETYDRNFLVLAGMGEDRANASLAVYWYGRAGNLGSDEANELLQSRTARK
jgi:hypothetical protein